MEGSVALDPNKPVIHVGETKDFTKKPYAGNNVNTAAIIKYVMDNNVTIIIQWGDGYLTISPQDARDLTEAGKTISDERAYEIKQIDDAIVKAFGKGAYAAVAAAIKAHTYNLATDGAVLVVKKGAASTIVIEKPKPPADQTPQSPGGNPPADNTAGTVKDRMLKMMIGLKSKGKIDFSKAQKLAKDGLTWGEAEDLGMSKEFFNIAANYMTVGGTDKVISADEWDKIERTLTAYAALHGHFDSAGNADIQWAMKEYNTAKSFGMRNLEKLVDERENIAAQAGITATSTQDQAITAAEAMTDQNIKAATLEYMKSIGITKGSKTVLNAGQYQKICYRLAGYAVISWLDPKIQKRDYFLPKALEPFSGDVTLENVVKYLLKKTAGAPPNPSGDDTAAKEEGKNQAAAVEQRCKDVITLVTTADALTKNSGKATRKQNYSDALKKLYKLKADLAAKKFNKHALEAINGKLGTSGPLATYIDALIADVTGKITPLLAKDETINANGEIVKKPTTKK